MDDPTAVRVREPVEDLRRRLHRLAVAQLAAAHRLAQRAAAHILVGDVDVTGVGAEAVRAQTAFVPQPGGRFCLAFGAVRGLALPRNDLERDVEPVPLVPREPDGAGTAAAKRAERAVAVEDELPAWERMSSSGHDFSRVGRRSERILPSDCAVMTEALVTVASFEPSFAMSSRDTDFEFDFFEEPETQEASGRSDRSPRRGGRGPRMPRGPIRPRAGFTPLLRLLGLIAFAILIVVLLLLWVQSCQEDKKRDAYSSYMTSMKAVGDDSQRVGRELSDALTTQGIKPAELQKQLGNLVQQQELATERARELDPPGPLHESHDRAIEALGVPRQRPCRPLRGVPAHAGVEGRGRGRGAARLAGRAARRE